MNIDSILELTAKLKDDEYDLYNYMTHSFINEIVDFESYDENADLYDEDLLELLNDILKKFGVDALALLLACATEFVITNRYPMPGKKKLWNCIDHILTKYKKSITAEDADYLQGLNKSYMSIYEVIDVTEGESITLREMIGTNKTSVIVKEHQGSQNLKKKDVIGVRVINNGKELVIPSTILPLSRNLAKNIVKRISFISNMMLQIPGLKEENKKIGIDEEGFELNVKQMWAKEIVEGWYSEL